MREETKQKIFIIGCGGTGSNYIKELARYLATNRNYMINADVILIDGDTVEEKNLERQSFTPEDLLMNKAEAMALAVSDMYNLTFSYVPEYIASKEHMLRIMRNTYERESYEEEETFVPIIIGCVDNHNCRKILHEIFEEYTDIIYIDAANEFSTGEVVVGIKNNQAVIAPDRAFYFPEVLEDSKSVLEMSCTELNNVKQNDDILYKLRFLQKIQYPLDQKRVYRMLDGKFFMDVFGRSDLRINDAVYHFCVLSIDSRANLWKWITLTKEHEYIDQCYMDALSGNGFRR